MKRSAPLSSPSAEARRLRVRRCAACLASAGLLSLGVSSVAAAEEWAFVGARYQGMGGAGVAVVDDGQASYWNPGALAFQDGYDVSLPIGAQAAAEGSVLSDVDRVVNFIDSLQSGDFDTLLIDIGAGTTLTPAQLQDALGLALVQLPALDQEGEGLVGNVDASLLVRVGRVAVSGLGLGYFGADPVFDRVNIGLSGASAGAAIDAFIDPSGLTGRTLTGAAASLATTIQARFTTAMSTSPAFQAQELVYTISDPSGLGLDVSNTGVQNQILNLIDATINPANSIDNNTSGAFVRGLAVEQVGVAYAHPFWKKRIGIGANVKYMYGHTYNKFIRYDDVNSAKDLLKEITDANRTEDTHTGSLDVGLMFKPFEFLRFGVTARNVTAPKFKLAPDPTMPGNDDITLDPQVRAGAALWILPNLVVAVDADLTENESELLQGFKSRLVSAGTELKLPIGPLGLALRGGAYVNTASDANSSVALTAGLGLRFWHFNLDIAGGASPNTEKVEAANGERIPSRFNLSALLSFSAKF